jgi:hypothetical protein
MGAEIFSEQKGNKVNKTVLVSQSFKEPLATKEMKQYAINIFVAGIKCSVIVPVSCMTRNL